MASAGTAYVDVEAKLDSFGSDIDAAVSQLDVQVEVGAVVDEAQAEIESLDGGDVSVEVGAETEEAQAAIEGIDGGEVPVKVKAETEEAKAQVDDLSGSIGGLADAAGVGGGALGGMTDELLGLTGASAGATAGVGALLAGLVFSVGAAGEAEVASALLGNTLRQSGADAYLTADAVQSLATEIQGYSGISDEVIQDSARMLLSFANVRTEAAVTGGVFERATKATADLARFLRSDAVTAAGMLGRALDDPIAGTTALTRAKVSFTDSERAAIKAMAEAGDILGAQNAILDAVEGNAKGAAEAYGSTMVGETDKAKESIGDLAEVLGGEMVPALTEAAGGVAGYANALIGLSNAVADFGGGALGDVQEFLTRGAIQTIPFFGPFINDLTQGEEAAAGLGTVVGDLPGALSATATATSDAAAAAGDFAAAQDAAAQAVAGTLPTLGGIIGEVDRAGEAFGVLNASSDPQAIIDNLSLALFAWDDFQNNITQIDDWGPRIAGALQQLGPEVAGGLTNALAEGNIATVVQLDGLIAQIEAKGGDAAAVLTGFAQTGMAGAVAAVEGAAGPMGAAGTQAGTEGAAGIDAGLEANTAAAIGSAAGVLFGGAVSSGIATMAPVVSAMATSVIENAGSTDAAFNRGRALGSSYGAGLVSGLAGQVGAVSSNAALLRAAAAVESFGVGEEGPRMFVPRRSGAISTPAATASGGGGGITIENLNVTAPAGGNAREFALTVRDELRQLERAGR